jgi:uncharacterized protein
MTNDIRSILELQEKAVRVMALEKEIALLPTQIADIMRALEKQQKQLDADRETLRASQGERKAQELAVASNQQKITKLKDQMGAAKTNEQYKAFQHEIEFCTGEISKAEDRILELMETAETLEAKVRASEAELATERKELEQQTAAAKKRSQDDQREVAKLKQEQEAIFAALPAELQRTVEHLRRKHKNGVIAAEISEGRCQTCMMAIRPAHFQALRNTQSPMFCESCGRLIFWNPPVNLEQEAFGPR